MKKTAILFSLLLVALMLIPVYAYSEPQNCASSDFMCRIQKTISDIRDRLGNTMNRNTSSQQNPFFRNCTNCTDGTLCGQKNSRNMTCWCSDFNKDGSMDICLLQAAPRNESSNWPGGWGLKNCSSCYDGTQCSQKNSKNMTCECRDVNRDNTTELCYLTMPPRNIPPRTNHSCSSCSDGTACGANNTRNFTCECRDFNKDSVNDICILMRIPQPIPVCTNCTDGTSCGQNNSANSTCLCRDINRDNQTEFCFLWKQWKPSNSARECNSCADGTVCGQNSSRGIECMCRDLNKDGKNDICIMIPHPGSGGSRNESQGNHSGGNRTIPGWTECTKCNDGTLCGQKTSQGWNCTCTDINRDGKNELCSPRWDWSNKPWNDSWKNPENWNLTNCVTLNMSNACSSAANSTCNRTGISIKCSSGRCNVTCGGEVRTMNCTPLMSYSKGTCRACCIQPKTSSTNGIWKTLSVQATDTVTLEGCLYSTSDSSIVCNTNCAGAGNTKVVVIDLASGKLGLALDSSVQLGSIEYALDESSGLSKIKFSTAESAAFSSTALSRLGADTSKWIVSLYCSQPSGSARVTGVSKF